MKKLLIIVCLLCACSANVYAIDGQVYVEYIQDKDYRDPLTGDVVQYATGITLKETFWKFTPFIDVKTYIKDRLDFRFNPSSVVWTVGAELLLYEKQNKRVRLVVSHMCQHAISYDDGPKYTYSSYPSYANSDLTFNTQVGKYVSYKLVYDF